jgi:hypothetical protein
MNEITSPIDFVRLAQEIKDDISPNEDGSLSIVIKTLAENGSYLRTHFNNVVVKNLPIVPPIIYFKPVYTENENPLMPPTHTERSERKNYRFLGIVKGRRGPNHLEQDEDMIAVLEETEKALVTKVFPTRWVEKSEKLVEFLANQNIPVETLVWYKPQTA